MKLNEQWTAEVVGRMHRCRITSKQLAKVCNYSIPYLSSLLNCKKPSNEKTRERVFFGLKRLENEITGRYE